MNTADFENEVENSWPWPESLAEGTRQHFVMCMGLAGETGEVCELLKKEARDGELDKDDLLLELGDVLHYLTRIATSYGLTLDEVMRANIAKLELRRRGRDLGLVM